MNNKKLVRIVVPILIVLIVAGIWLVKNVGTISKDPVASQVDLSGGELVADDPNFELEAEAIDLETLKAYGLPIIIDFGSDSCIPCQQMAPVLQSMNAAMRGKAIIKFVDVWKHTTAANDYPVQVIPTQVIINADGTPYVPSDSMSDSGIEFTQYSSKETGEHVFTTHQGGLTEEEMQIILVDMGVF
jgi:thioredoxin 1